MLNKLVSLWVEPKTITAKNGAALPSPVPGFEQFLYSSAVKLCFEVPLQSNFDFGDAQSFQVSAGFTEMVSEASQDEADIIFQQVLGEMANFLKALLQKRTTEFTEFMQTTFFPSIQCPPEAAQAFMTALQEAPE